MSFKKLIFAFLSIASVAFADDAMLTQPIGPFGGLNTNISQEAIDATQSPDLLNVDISPGGKSVKKRQGYGLDVTLSVSTSAIHNLYKFFDSGGNEVRLAFNDNRINSSINGASWSVIATTGTIGATWDCTDYLGYAYCVSSAFDNPIKTNGTILGTTGVGGSNAVPAGSIISNSGDRLLVGATASNPSRLYYSQSAVFTNFTLGVQPSDSSFEDIVAPGSKLTHIAYRFGRWLWWKDQSFGFIVGTGQFDLQIVTVSNTIGTFDNTDVFDGNYVYFRGSDSQIYTYDGSTLSRSISTDISPTLRTINRRKSNSWTQSSQAEFQSGSIVPMGRLSTSASPGDVIVSTNQVVEISSTQWVNGIISGLDMNASSITIKINNLGNINDNGFENSTGSDADAGCTISSFWSSSAGVVPHTTQNCSPNHGTYDVGFANMSGGNAVASIIDLNGNTLASTSFSSVMPTCPTVCNSSPGVWNTATISAIGNIGKRVKIKFIDSTAGSFLISTNSYILGGNITFSYAGGQLCPHNITVPTYYIDDILLGSSTISTSGFYTSKVYDSGLSSAAYQLQETGNLQTSTPTFSVMTATSATGVFSTILTSTATGAIGNRYAIFSATIPFTSVDDALTSITSLTMITASSGTYYSVVENAPNITAWNTLGITDILGSSITYYVRSSTSIFTVLSSTPSWVIQTKNSTVATSTGTYFQLRADFYVISSTVPSTLNDFTFNWFEGSASDKMYAIYFNNGIWFSVSIGNTITNNRILRYDLVSNLWTIYDIASNGFITYSNSLYFGDPAAGKVYQFGNSVTSDNGAPINAYWKSKAFFGDSPFNDKDLRLASWYIGESSGTTLNLTYTLDENLTIASNINLFDSRRNIIQNNRNLPLGSIGTNFNVQFGDNSSNPGWELFGGAIQFIPKPWKVSLQ